MVLLAPVVLNTIFPGIIFPGPVLSSTADTLIFPAALAVNLADVDHNRLVLILLKLMSPDVIVLRLTFVPLASAYMTS